MASMDVFSRLMMDRITFLGVPIDDDVANIIQVLSCVQVNVSTIYYVNPTNTLHTDLEIYDQS